MDSSLESNRPHFRTTIGSTTVAASTTTTSSELFICFTSRLSSSSSMKLTKSILSPGRVNRESGPITLSSSLSRRLRTNGSLKGGASPFLTTAGKKRGCGFENPEPSSPKVTCIGQVRVKTKKKVKQTRSLSRRRSGEISFRKIENNGSGDGLKDEKLRFCSNGSAHFQQREQRNQRWVHLPVSICEAIRAFGSEFSCLFPCKSSCFSRGEKCGDDEVKRGESNCGGECFSRWLVSVNDGEGGKRREIELVVGGGDEIEEEGKRVSMRSSRRHVFEDIEVKDDRIEVKGQSFVDGEEVEGGRVSICVPPKNALLLMRCRSDPMKMADLANRFSWDANAAVAVAASVSNVENGIIEEDEEEEVRGVGDGIEEFERVFEGKDEIFMVKESEILEQDVEASEELEIPVENLEVELEAEVGEIDNEEELVTHCEEKMEDKEGEELSNEIEGNEGELIQAQEQQEGQEEEEEVESNMSSFEDLLNQETTDQIHQYEDCPIQLKEQQQQEEQEESPISPICHLSPSTTTESESESSEETIQSSTEIPDETPFEEQQEETSSTQQNQVTNIEQNQVKIEPEKTHQEFKEEKPTKVLPDCLLLMMCEPKLSMEVSKETWVCSTDFVRWLPQRPPKQPPTKPPPPTKTDNPPPAVKRRLSIDSKPPKYNHNNDNNVVKVQPGRSSCSLPAAAAALERKLANAAAYEPFVLTRCKSEPMRTAAAKLVPDWKNAVRKMEQQPHRRATVGVGPA